MHVINESFSLPVCLAQLWQLTVALAAAALGLQTLKRASDPLGQSLTPPSGKCFERCWKKWAACGGGRRGEELREVRAWMWDRKAAQLGKERKMESCTDEGCCGSNSDEAQRRMHQIDAQNSCFFLDVQSKILTFNHRLISVFGDHRQLVSLDPCGLASLSRLNKSQTKANQFVPLIINNKYWLLF